LKIIIIGGGEIGLYLARRLSQENEDIVVIEKNENKVKQILENYDVQVLHGNGSSLNTLRKAGIEHAEMVIAVTDSDEVNMIVSLIAGTQAKIPLKIARIRNTEYSKTSEILGKKYLNINLAINPESEAIDNVIKLLEIPGASDVINFADGKVQMIGVRINNKSNIIGKKLLDFKDGDFKGKFLIAAISRGSRIIIPRGSDTFFPGDFFFAITEPNQIPNVFKFVGTEGETTKRVMILGGGNFALNLARKLEEKGINTKIIEEDKKRCIQLAEMLDKVIVLQGKGTDKDLLKEEGIKDMSLFIAASEDEEKNVLVSLLAKRLGAKRVMALTNDLTYHQLISTIGIDVVISPTFAAVNSILRYIRRGKVISVATFQEDAAEAIEVVALETSDLVSKPLKDIKFPKGAIIGAVVRNGNTIIPTGNTVILPGDRVIIVAIRSAIPKVEKRLMVKLEYF